MRLYLLIVCLVVATACSAAGILYDETPVPSPTHTPPPTETPFVIPAVSVPRPTLPPTFTPTDTLTPVPPLPTRTPTITPSPAPTLSAAAICDSIATTYNFHDGHTLAWNYTLTMVVQTSAPGVTLRFLATHRLSGENLGAEVNAAAGLVIPIQIPVNQLPRPGLYDWTLVAITDAYGEICQQGGYFFVGRPEWVVATETPTATES